jgi:hypothetical protein
MESGSEEVYTLSLRFSPDLTHTSTRGTDEPRWIRPLVLVSGLLATRVSTAVLRQATELRDRPTCLHTTEIELCSIEDQCRLSA